MNGTAQFDEESREGLLVELVARVVSSSHFDADSDIGGNFIVGFDSNVSQRAEVAFVVND